MKIQIFVFVFCALALLAEGFFGSEMPPQQVQQKPPQKEGPKYTPPPKLPKKPRVTQQGTEGIPTQAPPGQFPKATQAQEHPPKVTHYMPKCINITKELKHPEAMVFSGVGMTTADLMPLIDTFKNIIGIDKVMEVTWDDIPENMASPNLLPADYFIDDLGLMFCNANPGSEFQVSSANKITSKFGELDPSFQQNFVTYSAERLFRAVNSSVLTVDFFLPGTRVPATVESFGAIFTDVDLWGSTLLEFFDEQCRSIGVFQVPPYSSGLSFLGIRWLGAHISRVLITSGNLPLDMIDIYQEPLDKMMGETCCPLISQKVDYVVMDNFIYTMPTWVPYGVLQRCPMCLEEILLIPRNVGILNPPETHQQQFTQAH